MYKDSESTDVWVYHSEQLPPLTYERSLCKYGSYKVSRLHRTLGTFVTRFSSADGVCYCHGCSWTTSPLRAQKNGNLNFYISTTTEHSTYWWRSCQDSRTATKCQHHCNNLLLQIHPPQHQEDTSALVQALVISCLDYCNSLLAGVPACAIWPLQLIQNAAFKLVFNLFEFSHTTLLLCTLHWLLVAARFWFKTLVLANCAVNDSGPSYIQDMAKLYTPARPLRSTTTR